MERLEVFIFLIYKSTRLTLAGFDFRFRFPASSNTFTHFLFALALASAFLPQLPNHCSFTSSLHSPSLWLFRNTDEVLH